jgi:peptidoglycan hydrolase-like amidase
MLILLSIGGSVLAESLEDVTTELDETKKLLNLSVSATNTNEKNLSDLRSRLQSISERVKILESELVKKEEEIKVSDKRFEKIQSFLQEKISAHYKRLNSSESGILTLLFTDSFSNLINNSFYQSQAVENNKQILITTALQIRNLEEAKKRIDSDTKSLRLINAELDRQTVFLSGEVESAKVYQQELQTKIADLTARQQSIISARSSQINASVGDSELEYDDYNSSREFSPGFSPAFAAFSFGAYTHRKGMSQYGAKARADSGQSAESILLAYFPGSVLEQRDSPQNINVEGIGEIAFEDNYLMGIAEMMASWPKEVLKAQAIAARTYALRYVGWPGESRSICTTQSCQVYLASKAASTPQAWRDAVNETRGKVLMKDGQLAQAFYSSTTGGYLTTSGWDTLDGTGNNFIENAWERKAKSPWFYKAWYRESYSNSSSSCGRQHPWLSEAEFADILNAWIVRASGNADEVSRILPTTINSCSVGGVGGNPYTTDDLAQVADRYGGRFTTISSVGVSYSSDGSTASVNLITNKGSVSISGSDFKQSFNLRSPGYLSIKNALFNIERK